MLFPVAEATTTTFTTTAAAAVTGRSQRPPLSYAKAISIVSDLCFAKKTETFACRGHTADGRPWYSAYVEFLDYPFPGTVYIFYDSNCDGKSGAAHGHPQWVISEYKPKTDRLVDIDGTGTCVQDQYFGQYTKAENFDWTPPMGVENLLSCPATSYGPDGKWGVYISAGGLQGCSQPYPDHAYTWTTWSSKDGSQCGGGRGSAQGD